MKKIYSLLLFFCFLNVYFNTTKAQGNLVISQVYSTVFAGGTASIVSSYIELFNRSNAAINIGGFSLQYHSQNDFSSYTNWYSYPLPNATINPGQYYLIEGFYNSGGSGTYLQAVDYYIPDMQYFDIDRGTLALVNNSTVLTDCNFGSNVIDRVSWGSAICQEGFSSAPVIPDHVSALFRKDAGCQDTDDDSWDFVVLPPSPRTTNSPINICPFLTSPSYVAGPAINNLHTTQGTASTSEYYSLSAYN